MKCFTLTESGKRIIDHIDVSSLHTAHLFTDPKKVKTAAFNITIPDLSWETVIQSIINRSDPDIFLYACVEIVPGNSLSSVITEDCILVSYDVNEFKTLPEDKSMILLTSGSMVYRLCYHNQTAIESIKSGKVYYNDNGSLTEAIENKPDKKPEEVGKYGIELSF